MKGKMFGFLKNLLPYRPAATTPPSPAPPPFDAPAPTSLSRLSPRRSNLVHHNARSQDTSLVELPLQKILGSLPLELQPRLLQAEVGPFTVAVPLEKVLAQLASGAVKIPFGELRQAAPGVFSPEADRDRVLVPLPLAEILARLNPALITRRRVQRQIEVPAEISSPFDPNGQSLVFSVGPTAEPVPAPPSARQTSPGHSVPLAPPRGSVGSVPAPAPPAAAPTSASPISMPTAPLAWGRMAPPPPPSVPSPFTFKAPAPASTPAPAPQAPIPPSPPAISPGLRLVPGANGNGNHSLTAQPPMPQAIQSPPSELANPPTEEESLIVTITSLAEIWPEAIRKEIVEQRLVETKVALPLQMVEQALKQGRIAFSWKTLRGWVKPAPLPTVSVHDSLVLELPLKVIAPIFLARQREAHHAQQKVTIDAEIPNLFFGFPQAEPANAPARASADTNYYVWEDTADTVRAGDLAFIRPASPGTKFVAKYATPNEIVSRAAALDGVAGALIALPDGLMVASRLSTDLNPDTLAAFLPQIFGKMSQCTKELRMGDLNNLNFTVGNVPWKIFRVNAIFFAAFGRVGAPLPTQQLAALAAELDHKPKQ